MDSDYRSYIRHSASNNFLINVAINGALGWWLLREHESLTVWGAAAYGPDLLITGFLLSVIVSAILMEVHRRKAAQGAMEPVGLRAGSWLDAATKRSRWLTCIAFGVAGLLASGVVLTLLIATTASLSVPLYAGIKGLWAGALAGAVVAPATAIGLTIGATQPVQA